MSIAVHKKPEKHRPKAKHPRVFGNRFGQKLTIPPKPLPARIPAVMKFYATFTWKGQQCMMLCPSIASRNEFIRRGLEPKTEPVLAFDHNTREILEIHSGDAGMRIKSGRSWAKRLLQVDSWRRMHLA